MRLRKQFVNAGMGAGSGAAEGAPREIYGHFGQSGILRRAVFMDNQSKSKQPQRIGNHKDVFFADFSSAHLGTLPDGNRIAICLS